MSSPFKFFAVACLVCAMLSMSPVSAQEPEGLRLAVFDVDATPPVGSQMAYDVVKNHWDMGLRARGVALLGAGNPIVLCAVDWIGIANGANDEFRAALAEAAGTSPDRVAVHVLHQHDAPACDFSAEEILRAHGHTPQRYEGAFARELMARLAEAVRASLPEAKPVTHVGVGAAEVREVASNRRIMGEDGKVRAMRFTTCADPALRAEPEGVIDPMVTVVSLWNGEEPLAVLSYYATHPQSYYRTGLPNPDYPGVARFLRQMAVPSALHVHFTGAAGNIGAGKYNDGSKENRMILAERLADGMRRAWESTTKSPLTPEQVAWGVAPVLLPVGEHLNEEALEAVLSAPAEADRVPEGAASDLAWLRRCRDGHRIDITCLALGPARILHLPGELFVEYQLAAKALRPDLFVAMAAYGDYGTGYIGTTAAYAEGGYETGPDASLVAPEVEGVLMDAIKGLLNP